MGECFVRFYREKVKNTWKIAFFSAFIIGFLIHIYKFTNTLLVADSLYNFYSTQDMLASGRWFLSIACAPSSYFDLPWVTGLLSLFYMGIAAAAIAEVFEMKNPCLIAVSSGILVSMPSIYATFGYGFTADGYMLAMLLSSLSVCLTKISRLHTKKAPLYMVLSAVCICLSCGIYQAYISFSFILAVCYFIMELLENRHTTKEQLNWIGAQVIIYVAALAAYFVIWKLRMHLEGVVPTTYQGVSNIGTMPYGGILNTVIKCIKSFIFYIVEWNFLRFGITRWLVLNVICVAAFGIGLLVAVLKSGCIKRKLQLVLLVLCLISIPFGCYVLLFTTDIVYYHAIMLQSFAVLFLFIGVLWERWGAKNHSTVVFLLLCVYVFNNGIMANTYYKFLDQSLRRTQAVATEINTRIHLLDDGSIKYVALIGSLDDFSDEEMRRSELMRDLGAWKKVSRTVFAPEFLYYFTDFNLSYYRENDIPYPIMEYRSTEIPAPADWEFRFPLLSLDREDALIATEEFQQMPIWPAAGSVKVFDDTIVVKLDHKQPQPD